MVSLHRLFLLGSLLLTCSVFATEPSTIRICTDANSWYPFTFEKDGRSGGLHVEIVKRACQQVDLACEFYPLPWKRCLLSTKSGDMDALVSASYNKERAEYLSYPSGAETDFKSKWRISQAEYVVASLADSHYEFNGDLTSLPKPIFVQLGYSIINELKKANLPYIEFSKSKSLFKALLQEKKGSVISITPLPVFLDSSALFKDKFKIHAKPISSKSYFMAVSKQSTLPKAKKLELWQVISTIREDKAYIDQLLEKY